MLSDMTTGLKKLNYVYCFQDNDSSWCHTAAQALVTIQQLFGLIPNVYGQGRCAKVNVNKLSTLGFYKFKQFAIRNARFSNSRANYTSL